MPKEKNYNPVQAQRKADKAKEIKKGKAEVQARRSERLAKRNPDGIKRQIDDLKAVAEGGGKLSSHEQSVLEGLEKELKAVLKARELLGDKAPQFGSGRPHHDGGDRGSLGKRRRGQDGPLRRDSDSDSDEIPDDVARIPMPRDTPPPIPKDILDRWWAKRRAKRGGSHSNVNNNSANTDGGSGAGSSANAVPLMKDRGLGKRSDSDAGQPPKPMPVTTSEPRVVYESKPVVRDLRKEAVSAFMPAVVQTKLAQGKGEGGTLLEPEEADRLEQQGYLKATGTGPAQSGGSTKETESAASEQTNRATHRAMVEDVEDEEG